MNPTATADPERRTRDESIDTLRGLACVLLVMFHVVGIDPGFGLEVRDGFLRQLNEVLALVRMPLFGFVAGYVYADRPLRGPAAPFLRGKAMRLLVPMLCVGTIFAVVQAATPGHHAAPIQWHTLHLIPVAHYWFIEALFLIFVVITLLERLGLMSTPRRTLMCWVGSIALFMVPHDIFWFALSGATWLLVHFLLGAYCRQVRDRSPDSEFRIHPAVALAMVAALLAGYAVSTPHDAEAVLSLPVETACALLLFKGRFVSRPLVALAAYSYTIYLYHVFFTASARMGLRLLGVENLWVHLAVGIAAGILLSIVVDRVLSRWSPTRVLLLGKG